jgi:hypothetical protein
MNKVLEKGKRMFGTKDLEIKGDQKRILRKEGHSRVSGWKMRKTHSQIVRKQIRNMAQYE